MHICVLGAATSNHVVARAAIFAQFGHRVTLVSPAPGPGCVRDDMGVELIDCVSGAKGKFDVLRNIQRAIQSSDFDVYHAHYAAEPTTWAAWLLRKRPLVVTVMGGDVLFDEQGTLGPVGRWLTRRAVLGADLVTVKSAQLGRVVAQWGVQSDRIMDVLWGVDRRVYAPDPQGAMARRQAWGVDEHARVLFSPRMLKPLYQQHLMVEALPAVLQDFENAILVISTYQQDDAYRAAIDARARELGVGAHVRYVPSVPSDDMAASYSASDVVLSLPPSDGTPQSVMEAMACETPVVMADLERFKPLFKHGETSWMTTLDAPSVSAGILALLSDRELSARIAEGGAAMVRERADFQSQARAVEQRLLELAGGAR